MHPNCGEILKPLGTNQSQLMRLGPFLINGYSNNPEDVTMDDPQPNSWLVREEKVQRLDGCGRT
jgi:hypothetical protein